MLFIGRSKKLIHANRAVVVKYPPGFYYFWKEEDKCPTNRKYHAISLDARSWSASRYKEETVKLNLVGRRRIKKEPIQQDKLFNK